MRGGGAVLLIGIGLLVLYVAITGKYDCFTSLFSCLLEVPLQRSESDAYYSDPLTGQIPGPGQTIPQAGQFFPFPSGSGGINIPGVGTINIPGLNIPQFPSGGTVPTFPSGGLGGILGGIFGQIANQYPQANIPPIYIPPRGAARDNPFPLRGYSFFNYLPGGQWGKDTFGQPIGNPFQYYRP